jgi:hypothetical protein
MVAEKSDHFGVGLSQNLNFLSQIITVLDGTGQSVTLSNQKWTLDSLSYLKGLCHQILYFFGRSNKLNKYLLKMR